MQPFASARRDLGYFLFFFSSDARLTFGVMVSTCVGTCRHPTANTEEAKPVPSIAEIQAALVSLGDKEAHFEGSCDWIGSTEVFLCLDHFYQVPCRILHASTGGQVAHHIDTLLRHFEQQGSPVMMGGDSDASSKGVLGVCQTSSGESHLLVLDPHWYRNDAKHGLLAGAKAHLQQDGWISWRSLGSLMESSFYNLCLPLLPSTAGSTL
ncbi:inactive Ufm1-specific protease 1 isoform X2 [Rhipicephalus sanguineus]|uniref:inactive Ufm1-specific protease 1 isoform X2 n=1 Tax=Rhipicephalus sanguineus TaxID=34632 RepID=UPI00189509F5|nr:inactive Ufm1-specific protease 1 isoform X2 [Rhipicephalus sanguineus]